MKMNENNPLRFNPSKFLPSEINRSGRPTNENQIKFGPQPKSLVSQMLKKIKEECGDSAISINVLNRSQEKCIARVENAQLENIDAHSSSKITFDPELAVPKIPNSNKDNRIKMYPCDFPSCKYVCKLSSNLVKHKRTHTSEKPYLCHLCSFRSNFINSLKVHQRTHTAEKPYVCNYCSYRCNSSSNLKKHCKHRHCIASIAGQRTKTDK